VFVFEFDETAARRKRLRWALWSIEHKRIDAITCRSADPKLTFTFRCTRQYATVIRSSLAIY